MPRIIPIDATEIIETIIPAFNISWPLIILVEKAIAFGGVDIGSAMANEHDKATVEDALKLSASYSKSSIVKEEFEQDGRLKAGKDGLTDKPIKVSPLVRFIDRLGNTWWL